MSISRPPLAVLRKARGAPGSSAIGTASHRPFSGRRRQLALRQREVRQTLDDDEGRAQVREAQRVDVREHALGRAVGSRERDVPAEFTLVVSAEDPAGDGRDLRPPPRDRAEFERHAPEPHCVCKRGWGSRTERRAAEAQK